MNFLWIYLINIFEIIQINIFESKGKPLGWSKRGEMAPRGYFWFRFQGLSPEVKVTCSRKLPCGKQSRRTAGLEKGQQGCRAVGAGLGCHWEHQEGEMGLLDNRGSFSEASLRTPCSLSEAPRNPKHNIQQYLVQSAEHLWKIHLAPKYLSYCRKSHLITLPGISLSTASFVWDFVVV